MATPWIELPLSLWADRKTLVLAEALDIDDTHAAGLVARLWCWCLDNAAVDWEGQRGALVATSPRVIASAAGWRGDAAALRAALVASEYLYPVGDNLGLHDDWWRSAGKLLARRRADAERKRDDRMSAGCPADIRRTSDGHPTDTARMSVATVQYSTPEQSKAGEGTVVATQPHHAAATRPPYTPAFEAFWADYPHQPGRRWIKAQAFDGWLRANAEAEDQAALLDGVAAWKLGKDWREGKIWRPDRFVEQRMWEGPPDPWAGQGEPAARYRGQRGEELGEDIADFTARLKELNRGRGDVRAGDAQTPALALSGESARQARQG